MTEAESYNQFQTTITVEAMHAAVFLALGYLLVAAWLHVRGKPIPKLLSGSFVLALAGLLAIPLSVLDSGQTPRHGWAVVWSLVPVGLALISGDTVEAVRDAVSKAQQMVADIRQLLRREDEPAGKIANEP